jgi:glycosyltransferase involved in cell wall biosynthesis
MPKGGNIGGQLAMKLEVLVSTMHQEDCSIAEKMNIRTNAVIINQCDRNDYLETLNNGRCIKMYSFAERGIGKSRNNALMRATEDICLFADEDVVYVDDYEKNILGAFRQNPKADIIFFNVSSHGGARADLVIGKEKRIRFYNCLRYGSVNIAFRRNRVIKCNVFFSLLFGGGAPYGHGEDSLFIWECLKSGLAIYTSPVKIADVYQESSTWFTGYNEKFYFDQGVLFGALSKTFAFPLIVQYAFRRYGLYKKEMSFIGACQCMIKGLNHFRSL